MTIEEYKKEVNKNIESLFNKANKEEKELLNNMINIINDQCEKEQELIDYLKKQKEQYSKLYDISCDVVAFDRYENLVIFCKEILSKIEKE